jgi:hypothetical protein
MSLVPFHRTRFRTRLHHLVFGRKIRGDGAGCGPHGFVLEPKGAIGRFACDSVSKGLHILYLALRCHSTRFSHVLLLDSFYPRMQD